MKELSIEEKAKAYDEALEKARQLCAYPTTKPFINDLQDLFPELKESEDERIKKTLINFFSKGAEYDSSTNGIKDRNIIAWLEKQGEQKQYDIDVLEKHITKDSISELAHTVIVRNGWEIVDAKEQNPVWSEEDEVMIKVFDSIIRYIVEVVDKDALERFGTNREELFSWLKSLKNRVIPQPKPAWSEYDDDDAWMNDIISKVENNLQLNKAEIDWLKSLKDRYAWKPSEEQLKALELIINSHSLDAYHLGIVQHLYNDLKKLKGE